MLKSIIFLRHESSRRGLDRQLFLPVFNGREVRDGRMKEFHDLGKVASLRFNRLDQAMHFLERFHSDFLSIKRIELVSVFQGSDCILKVGGGKGQRSSDVHP